MVALSAFYPYVLPSAPGCSEIMADQFIRDICIDFCSKSLIAQVTHDPINAVAGLSDYDLDPGTGLAVQMVLQAWFRRNPLEVINPDNIGTRPEIFNPRFDGADRSGAEPVRMTQKDGKSITVDPAPADDSANAITLLLAVKPTRTAVEVPDILFDDYAFEIGKGIASRLMLLPQQPFTNPQLAAAYNAEYVAARNAALLRAMNSYGRTQQRVDMTKLA